MEQKSINGGGQWCDGAPACPDGQICCGPPGGAQYCQACPCSDSCGSATEDQ